MIGFALGNGLSRAKVNINQLLRLGNVYACNGVYRTHCVTALVATDQPIAKSIQESGYSKHNRFYTRRPMVDSGAKPVPKSYHGFSSGPIAVGISALDGCKRIYLLGFDLGPDPAGKFNNIYAGSEFYKQPNAQPTYTGNWIKQLCKVVSDFPDYQFIRVMGETTANIIEFDHVKNLASLSMNLFLERINNEKDL